MNINVKYAELINQRHISVRSRVNKFLMDFDVIMYVRFYVVMFSADSQNIVRIGEKKNDRKKKQVEKFANINNVNVFVFCFACNEEDSLHYLYKYSFGAVSAPIHIRLNQNPI